MQPPTFIYGTAWKEERTEALVAQALDAGFRAIDTANQRKHYHEAGVGDALRVAFAQNTVTREELFLQTKFTFRRGQDHRLPYDPTAKTADQVRQSFDCSLEHLGVDYLDSLVLHGPTHTSGIASNDLEAWSAMEAIQKRGGTRAIGVSNIAPDQLEALIDAVEIPPVFVQNRTFAVEGWDAEVRNVCESHGVIYQGFSLLTANRQILEHPVFVETARRHRRTVPAVVFRLAIHLGILPLTGTTDALHMRADLESPGLALDQDELDTLWSAST